MRLLGPLFRGRQRILSDFLQRQMAERQGDLHWDLASKVVSVSFSVTHLTPQVPYFGVAFPVCYVGA